MLIQHNSYVSRLNMGHALGRVMLCVGGGIMLYWRKCNIQSNNVFPLPAVQADSDRDKQAKPLQTSAAEVNMTEMINTPVLFFYA